MKVKILKNLPLAIASTRSLVVHYKTSRAFKVFETFCFLKTLTDTGKIFKGEHSYDEFVKGLAAHCQVKKNTMYNRIDWLHEFELIKFDDYGNMLLESWTDVARTYHVNEKNFYEIEVNENTARLEYKLKALVIAELKNRLRFRFAQFISNNRAKDLLQSKLPMKIQDQSVQDIADYIVTCQQHSFKARTDSYDFWHSFRADFNCNVKTLMSYFKFDDARTLAYLKRVLCSKGLMQVISRTIESKCNTRSPRSIFTGDKLPLYLSWDEKTKTRFWRMPDAINLSNLL